MINEVQAMMAEYLMCLISGTILHAVVMVLLLLVCRAGERRNWVVNFEFFKMFSIVILCEYIAWAVIIVPMIVVLTC